jgi:hypothetical protein
MLCSRSRPSPFDLTPRRDKPCGQGPRTDTAARNGQGAAGWARVDFPLPICSVPAAAGTESGVVRTTRRGTPAAWESPKQSPVAASPPRPGRARAAPRPRAALTSPSSGPSPSPTLEAWVGPAGARRGHRLAASASPWPSWATASTMIILVAYRVACRVARRVVRRVADRVADRVVSAAARNSMKHEVKALGRGWLACRLLPLETLRQARPGTGEVAERSRGGAAQEPKRRRAGE